MSESTGQSPCLEARCISPFMFSCLPCLDNQGGRWGGEGRGTIGSRPSCSCFMRAHTGASCSKYCLQIPPSPALNHRSPFSRAPLAIQLIPRYILPSLCFSPLPTDKHTWTGKTPRHRKMWDNLNKGIINGGGRVTFTFLKVGLVSLGI